MKKLMLLFYIVCQTTLQAQQESVPLLKFEELEKKIAEAPARLLIVNFWATTCAPCVKELPHFMEINRRYETNPEFKMLLVSLDRAKDLERVKKFMTDKDIRAEVVLLDDNKRMNTWIPRIDPEWGGEIPVTVFYRRGVTVHFHNGEISKTELEEIISKHLD
ncbi:TlpA disulfide reductase family protein [Kaistella sp. PBT33-4]|uniref:TlpA family protein disulfide reductase n=1 Tax=Kaistella sp. PBT33-4 TaxID=3032000 RepID=UPI0023D80B87|nr:TlpA disulfide reductase family protein [Kaistella sp. PBT33-4]MDF0719313.1 TlpA disulfide reductase family protein [Kaistella sp. PBT33-4]